MFGRRRMREPVSSEVNCWSGTQKLSLYLCILLFLHLSVFSLAICFLRINFFASSNNDCTMAADGDTIQKKGPTRQSRSEGGCAPAAQKTFSRCFF